MQSDSSKAGWVSAAFFPLDLLVNQRGPLEIVVSVIEYRVSFDDLGDYGDRAIEELKKRLDLLLQTIPHRTGKDLQQALSDWVCHFLLIKTTYPTTYGLWKKSPEAAATVREA